MDSLVAIFTVLAATIFIISAVIVYCVIVIKNKKNNSENGYKHHQVDDILVNHYFSKQQESRIESISGKFVPKRPEDAQSRKQDFGTPSKCGKYDHFYITFHSAKTPLMPVDQSMTKYKTFHQEFYD